MVLYFTKNYRLAIVALTVTMSFCANGNQLDANENSFETANAFLVEANDYEIKARQSLLDANSSRKAISKARVEVRREKEPDLKAELLKKAERIAKELETHQKNGADYRILGQAKMQLAVDSFKVGLADVFEKWVTNQAPLTMDPETLDYISHNAAVRSVHPTMLNKMGTAEEQKNIKKDSNPNENVMTLKIASLMGQSAPADLNIAAFRLSNQQSYFAHIEVHNGEEQNNNVSQVPLNKIHQWRLIISDVNGKPVSNKDIKVVGHMPGHVHGLPTQPQVTQQLVPGVFLVEGIKFQMQGWWVIQFEIYDSENASNKERELSPLDILTFNLIL